MVQLCIMDLVTGVCTQGTLMCAVTASLCRIYGEIIETQQPASVRYCGELRTHAHKYLNNPIFAQRNTLNLEKNKNICY